MLASSVFRVVVFVVDVVDLCLRRRRRLLVYMLRYVGRRRRLRRRFCRHRKICREYLWDATVVFVVVSVCVCAAPMSLEIIVRRPRRRDDRGRRSCFVY